MTLWILSAACALLAVICAALTFRLCMIKKQLRSMREELPLTKEKGYDRLLTVALVDKDVSALAAEINSNLSYQKQLKLTTEQTELAMKRSVSDIAHDLRTPLTVIRGNLQMLEIGEQLTQKGKEQLRISMEKADSMKQMAEDFFELSVLESDGSAVQTERLDLTAALVEFIIANEAVIRCNGIEPEISLPEKSMFVMADEAMLQRMLSNLLNNALKHGHGSFSLSLLEEDAHTVIAFENALRPDSDIDTSRLFERTYRADKARHGSGAGLGLYIVRLLAHKQGAEVSARITGDRLSIRVEFATADKRDNKLQ